MAVKKPLLPKKRPFVAHRIPWAAPASTLHRISKSLQWKLRRTQLSTIHIQWFPLKHPFLCNMWWICTIWPLTLRSVTMPYIQQNYWMPAVTVRALAVWAVSECQCSSRQSLKPCACCRWIVVEVCSAFVSLEKNLSAFCLCEKISTYFNLWSVNKDTGLWLVFILSCFPLGLYFCRHLSHTVGLCERRWPHCKYQTFYLFNLSYFVLP